MPQTESDVSPGDDGPKAETHMATEEQLRAPWNEDGKWTVHGELPDGRYEEPFHDRDFVAYPESLDPLRSIGMAAINTKGRKHSRDLSRGQDNFSISYLGSGWEVLCVMDGHGDFGEFPAIRVARSLPYFLQLPSCSALIEQGRIPSALTTAFSMAMDDLKFQAKLEGIDLIASGSTAVCTLRHRDHPDLFVAHVGDSRAALIVPGRGVVEQTVDHTVEIEQERRRIEESGGQVTTVEYDDGNVVSRICKKGKTYPGLAMTRSVGDLFAESIGVISEPQISHWQVKPGGFLFLATDGIWEFMSSDEVADCILHDIEDGHSYEYALRHLVKKSRELWEKSEGDYCDDMTAVLVSLNGTPGPLDDEPPRPYALPRSRTGFFSREPVCGVCAAGCSCM